jgi:nucleoporin NUP42
VIVGASFGSAGFISAGFGAAGFGSAGLDSTGLISAGFISTGFGSAGFGSAGFASARITMAGAGTGAGAGAGIGAGSAMRAAGASTGFDGVGGLAFCAGAAAGWRPRPERSRFNGVSSTAVGSSEPFAEAFGSRRLPNLKPMYSPTFCPGNGCSHDSRKPLPGLAFNHITGW